MMVHYVFQDTFLWLLIISYHDVFHSLWRSLWMTLLRNFCSTIRNSWCPAISCPGCISFSPIAVDVSWWFSILFYHTPIVPRRFFQIQPKNKKTESLEVQDQTKNGLWDDPSKGFPTTNRQSLVFGLPGESYPVGKQGYNTLLRNEKPNSSNGCDRYSLSQKSAEFSYIPCRIHGTNGIFTYIYHKNQPNVGKYTIHGWYGYGMIHGFPCHKGLLHIRWLVILDGSF